MKKHVVQMALAATLGIPAAAVAQNVFPSTGNVGIRTSTPAAPLHIMGPGGGYGAIFDASPGMNFVQLKSRNGGSNYGSVLQFMDHSTLSGDIRSVASGGLWFATLGVERVFINASGNVGIGTGAPQHRLTIGSSSDLQPVAFRAVGNASGAWKGGGAFGGANATVIMGEVNGQAWLGAHNGNLSAWANLIINRDGGNVGIGTSNPLARLEVAGGVRCTTLDLTSDRAAKAGLETVDELDILNRLAAMPISTWHYKEAPAVQHIGPMAQDFKAAFGVGAGDKHISVVDGVGVSLAAIQGLHRELKDARAVLTEQSQEIDQLRREMAVLRNQMLAREQVNPDADEVR